MPSKCTWIELPGPLPAGHATTTVGGAVRAGATSLVGVQKHGKQQPALAEVPSPQQSVHSVPRGTERALPYPSMRTNPLMM